MRNRRRVALAGLACVLLCTWAALAFLRDAPDDAARAAERAAHAAAARDDAARRAADAAREGASKSELTPTILAVEPRLEWPDGTTLRRIAQRGRILFGGVVYAPDGSPCRGASVYCVGARSESGADDGAIATTDDHGAWRADVGRPSGLNVDGRSVALVATSSMVIGARKEGVGFAELEVEAESRRVDLHLHGGFAFKGTVVDNDDLRPVGGAELEARVGWYVERVLADHHGDFAFPSLPSGGVELSGRAPGYDSNGSFPFNFDRGRDVEITFRLTKVYRLRGKFTPWPSPLIAAASASVVLTPRSPHGDVPPRTSSGAVKADGSFELTLPICPECTAELDGADGPAWQARVDVNEEPHDVDLGAIELAPPAAIVGRLEVPDADLRRAIDVTASFPIDGGKTGWLRKRAAADGSFRLAPLPAGWVSVTVELDGSWIAWSRQESTLSPEERDEGGMKLAASEVRDLGVIAPLGTIVFGSVRDGRGDPVALAEVSVSPQIASSTWSDEEGRFHLYVDEYYAALRDLTLDLFARGFAPRRVVVEAPEHVAWIRHDVVLGDGVALRGKLVDGADAPLAGWSIRVEPGAAIDLTQSDGSFEIRGLEAGEATIRADPRSGAILTWKGVHPEQGEVTLRTTDAMADSIAK